MNAKENLAAHENHFPANTISDIVLLYNGNEQCTPGKKTGPTALDHYLFNLVINGKGSLSIDNQSYLLSQGYGFLVRPGQIYECISDIREPLHYEWIGFQGQGVQSILYNSKLVHINPIYHSDEWRALEEYISDSIRAVRGGDPGSLVYCQGMLLLILAHLLKHTFLLPEPKDLTKLTSEQEMYIHQAINYMHQNLSKPFTISNLADALGLNRSYFSRLFSRLCGIPPIRFLENYRLDQAWHLLRHTSMPVAKIANAVGFRDPGYFSKRFTDRYGISPSFLRNSGNQKNEAG